MKTLIETKDLEKEFFDLVIVGSGLAGLSTAYYASQSANGKNKEIAIITKELKKEASSFFAQGGLAAAVGKNDSPKKHFLDTIKAGHKINNEKVVKTLTEKIPEQIKELQELGLEFDEELGLEGMHSEKRVMQINGDKTGYELSNFLLKLCKENDIKIIKAEMLGLNSNRKEVNGLIVKENEAVREYQGNAFVLASGGYSGLWLNSTNPFAKGMAISKALKAGAEENSLEFQQFHPTTFEDKNKTNFLISEAVRGEGALLVNKKEKRIAEGLEKKELSGRDEISRLIFNELKKGKVFLDCTEKENSFWEKRFPTVYGYLEEAGLKMGNDLIPVSPAAHYSIGGIKVDELGRTNLNGLFAVGECSCNGLHGANRLSSNSLSECLVFGKITAESVLRKEKSAGISNGKIEWNEGKTDEEKLRELMWNNVGIIRQEKKLEDAMKWIEKEKKNSKDSRYEEQLMLAGKIVSSALKRKKTLGVHYRDD